MGATGLVFRPISQIRLPCIKPLFAPLLSQRPACIWIAGFAATQLSLVGAGMGGLGCPFREITGVPCPGCGLTTASLDFLRGKWRAGLACHAFAPVFLLGAAMFLLGAILPPAPQAALARWAARWEERTRFALWLGLALLIYWLVRLPKP